MITHKTQGIVLKTMPYKENDQLIFIYSYDYGKITLHARGTKKLTSKNASSVMIGNYSQFEIVEKQGICPLIRGETINYFHNIQKDIHKQIVMNILLEYFYRYIEENVPSKEDFHFLLTILTLLDEAYSYKTLYTYILLFIMKHNGVILNLKECVVCQSHKVSAFSLDKGGFVCMKHATDKDYFLSLEELKALRYLYYIQLDHLHKLEIKVDLKIINHILNYYCEEICGIQLKTKKFLKLL